MNLNVNSFGRLVDEQGAPLADSRKPLLRFNEPLTLSFVFPQGTVSPGDAFTLAVDDNFLQGDELVALHETPAIDAEASTVAFAAIPATSRKLHRLTNGVPGLVQAHLQVIRYAGGDETAARTVVDDTIFLRGVVFVKGATAVLLDPNAAYTKDETDALLSTAPEFQFSDDGEAWHSDQAEGDAYLRFRSAFVENAPWSRAVRYLPADIPTALSDLTSDSTHRTVTDDEKTIWGGKLSAVTVNGMTATVAGGTASVSVPAITEMVVNGTTATVSDSTARVTIPTGSVDAVEALDAMPAASEANAGRVVLYSGTATADYATGHQYRCDAETATPTYRVAVNRLAEDTYGFDGVYEATATPDEYVSHTGGIGKDSDVWLKRTDPSDPWGLYDTDGYVQYRLISDKGPAGIYDSADAVMPELWGTATVTEETPGGETYFWTDITPLQADAITSIVANGSTASVSGGTATVHNVLGQTWSMVANDAISWRNSKNDKNIFSITVSDNGNLVDCRIGDGGAGSMFTRVGASSQEIVLTATSRLTLGWLDVTPVLHGGAYQNNARGFCILQDNGSIKSVTGFSSDIITIPNATSAYTLARGCYEHTPSTAPTYTLPDIGDPYIVTDSKNFTRASEYDGTGYFCWVNGSTKRYTASATPAVGDNTYTNTALTSGARAITANYSNYTHEIILKVKFTDVQTLAFQDAQGNTLVPRPSLALASTSVVTYLCRWFGNAGGWSIYAVSEVE